MIFYPYAAKIRSGFIKNIFSTINTNNNNMKKLYQTFTLVAAALAMPAASALADVTLAPYTEDFDNCTNVAEIDWAPQYWGHAATTYNVTESNYVYHSEGGQDGGAFVSMTDQYSPYMKDDYLVTPPVKGKVSFYVKLTDTEATRKFFDIKPFKREGATLSTTTNAEVKLPEGFTISDQWQKVELELSDYAMIGFMLYNSGIDTFTADEMQYADFDALTISSVEWPEGEEVAAGLDGVANFTVKATVKNTGTTTISPDNELYTLTVGNFNYIGTLLTKVGELKCDAPLAPGESAIFEIPCSYTLEDPASDKSLSLNVQEGINGSRLKSGSYIKIISAKGILEVKEGSSKLSAGGRIDFGMTSGETPKTFTIANTGKSPLTFAGVELAETLEGCTFSLDPAAIIQPGESVEATLSLGGVNCGKYGNLTLKYNDGLADHDFSLNVTGALIGSDAWKEEFTDGIPQSWLNAAAPGETHNVRWDTRTVNGNVMLTQGNTTSLSRLVTPKLTIDPAQPIVFQAGHSSSSITDDSALKVYVSTDRENWQQLGAVVKTVSGRAPFNTFAWRDSSANQLEWYNMSTSRLEAGDYYVAFEAGMCMLDNVYGAAPATVDQDLIIESFTIPDAMVNYPVDLSVSVRNMLDAANAADSYTLSFYDGEVCVATATSEEIGAFATVTIPTSYTFHAAGETALTAILTFGEKRIEAIASTTVAEESSDAPVAAGAIETVSNGEPYCTDVYYSRFATIFTAEELNIPVGSVISKIALPGYNTGYYETTMKIRIGISATDKTGYSEEDMAAVADEASFPQGDAYYDGDYTFAIGGSADQPENFEITLDQPFTYEGGNLLFSFSRANGFKSSLGFASHAVEGATPTMIYKKSYAFGDPEASLSSAAPTVIFSVPQTVLKVTGTVHYGDTPVGGASVAVKADNVHYYATSAEDGTFELPVIQSDKEYVLTASYGSSDYTHPTPVKFEGNDVEVGVLKIKTTGVEGVSSDDTVIAVTRHAVRVNSEHAAVKIYSIDGNVVASAEVEGSRTFTLSAGIYIVEANGRRIKAIIAE